MADEQLDAALAEKTAMRWPIRRSTVRARQDRGVAGEARVARWLELKGFRILARNARLGRLEIDIVAIRNGLLVFCEVRTRSRGSLVSAIETLSELKIARLRRAAQCWIDRNRIDHRGIRFDVAAIEVEGSEMTLDYYEDAF